jgi:hypothetical protein
VIRLARRRKRAIDLGFDQDVVRAPDHHQVLDIVPPDKDELPLSIEAESIDKPKSRLSGSAAGNTQPMRENKPIDNRQNDQHRERCKRENRNLEGPVVA